jgi:hypothetical protein
MVKKCRGNHATGVIAHLAGGHGGPPLQDLIGFRLVHQG